MSFSTVDDFASGFAIATAPVTTSSFTALGNLLASTTYFLRVRALNYGGVPTSFTVTVSTLTLPPLPGTPGTPSGK